MRLAAQQLKDAGWEVVERDTPPMREAMSLQLLLWMSEYHYSGGAAIIKEDDPDANFVYAQLLANCETPTLTSLMDALQQRLRLAREWQQFLSEYPVLLVPGIGGSALSRYARCRIPCRLRARAGSTDDANRFTTDGYAGTLGSHRSGSAPMGVQLVSARFREDILLAAGADIESRNPPIGIANPD